MDSDYCSLRARSVYSRTDDLPGCLSCEGMVNLLYLVHVMGIFIGPVAGRLSHRYGICAGFFTAHAAAVGLLSEKKGLFRKSHNMFKTPITNCLVITDSIPGTFDLHCS